MDANPAPSIPRVVRTDYYAFLAALFLFILWSTYALFYVFSLGVHPFTFYTAITLSAVAIATIFWRYQSIQMLFSSGIEMSATVTAIWFYRGRGRIDYVFYYRGHEYQSGDDIVPSRVAQAIRVSDRVTVLIDPESPQRTIIQDFYI
jgi:hypothetical protein